jgi:GDP-D-mannose 3',5'-epimerase
MSPRRIPPDNKIFAHHDRGMAFLGSQSSCREATLQNHNTIVVAGAGGFIGGHLVATLRSQGHKHIRAVDVKPLNEWYQRFDDVDNLQLDLNLRENCDVVAEGTDEIYNLAANMGGMGFIEHNKALCMLSVLINTHMLQAALKHGCKKYFYSSSACVYNADKQKTFEAPSLKEEDAYPAQAEDGYGWEKLFSERMCRHFREDFGLHTRVARFHNVYGPWGTWFGGREKAPAAICRKVIEAKVQGTHEIEIWGTGAQTRSFMFADDCIKGIRLITDSQILEPINLGSSEAVSINQLVDIVEDIAGIKLKRNYNLGAPKGVNGRNSDNALIQKYLHWEPDTTLRAGLEKTYAWIYDQYMAREKGESGVVREASATR